MSLKIRCHTTASGSSLGRLVVSLQSITILLVEELSVSCGIAVNWPVHTLLEGDLGFRGGDFGQEGYEGPYKVEEAYCRS